MTDARPLQIGLVIEGTLDATGWSGIYAGLAGGLRTQGAEVVPLDITAPRDVERILGRLPGWRAQTGMRTAAVNLRLRRAGHIHALLMIGSRATVRTGLPLATYEDMTVRQALAARDAWVSQRPAAELRAWLARQAAYYTRAGKIFTMSRWATDSIVHEYGVPEERIHTVGAGINHVVEPATRDWSAPRFLFIGRDFERKNGPAVLRAFSSLMADRPDVRLDIVGMHPRIDQPGVVGHGPLALGDDRAQAKLSQLISEATCFVMPSRYEPFGIVYAEAAMNGIPSIATAVGGSFVNASCGVRVDPGNEAALLAAMRELSNGEHARRLGEAARRQAQLFTWPLVAGRMLRGFCELLGRPAGGLPDYL
jgi:glycosyltransferase involved in cell wall biosynthesis